MSFNTIVYQTCVMGLRLSIQGSRFAIVPVKIICCKRIIQICGSCTSFNMQIITPMDLLYHDFFNILKQRISYDSDYMTQAKISAQERNRPDYQY